MLGFSPNHPSLGGGWCSTDRLFCWDEWFQQGTMALVVEFSDLLSSLLHWICFQPWAQCRSCCQHWLVFSLKWIRINCHRPLRESHQEACGLQQISAGSLLTASQVLPGVQKKVVTSGLLHHVSLSVSMYEVNGEKKSGGYVDTAVKLPGHSLRSRNKQQSVFSRFSPWANNFSLLLVDDVIPTFTLPRSGELKGPVLYRSFWAQLFH